MLFPKPIHYAIGFIAIGASSIFTVIYLVKYLPRSDARERIGDVFTFRFDREFEAILALEALEILALYPAPEIASLYWRRSV
jgi:hypothetical protein